MPSRKLVALLLVVAHWSVAALPCAALTSGPAPAAQSHADGHPGTAHDAVDHAAMGHAHHAPSAASEAESATELKAPCLCGCGDAPAGSSAGARLGPALLRAAHESSAVAAASGDSVLSPRLPRAPERARDPAPI